MLFHQLLKKYSYFLIFTICMFSFLFSYFIYRDFNNKILSEEREVALKLNKELENIKFETSTFFYNYNLDSDNIDSLYHFFKDSPAEYQNWILHHPLFMKKPLSFIECIDDIYHHHSLIDGIDISLIDYPNVFKSTARLKSGCRVSSENYNSPKNSFPITIYDSRSNTIIGTAYISVNTDNLVNLVNVYSSYPMIVSIKNSIGNIMFDYKSNLIEKNFFRYNSGDFNISVGITREFFFNSLFKFFSLIMLFSLLLMIILLSVLNRVFSNYQTQIQDMVITLKKISDFSPQTRIDVENKSDEIFVISNQVNYMLDQLDSSIRRNYRLQLSQKEANMRALQSQIKPHFLYNTLEFFRMYAVTHGQEELANSIFQFSTLLRGSIAQSDLTTIKEELELCEKYSYICQIRYPKSIAYSFQIEEDCGDIKIPRFVFQPLVENYFIHGVDLKRKNNAISVNVSRVSQGIEILIRDNGKGMSCEKLNYFQSLLSNDLSIKSAEKLHSIGIENSHERMLAYFGNQYKISLMKNEGSGLIYQINLNVD